jgi:hypothetical protein
MSRATKRTALAALVAACALGAAAHAWLSRSDLALLVPAGGAQWIVAAQEPSPLAVPVGPLSTVFRHRFEVDALPDSAPLALEALRAHALSVNGEPLGEHPAGDVSWRRGRELDLAPHLRPGANEIAIEVTNTHGPPALLVHSRVLGLASDDTWEASPDGEAFSAAALATHKQPFLISQVLPTAGESFLAALPVWLPTFALGLLGTLWLQRGATPLALRAREALSPARVRWVLLAAWLVLCVNNIARIPLQVGFDAAGHYNYIAFIARRGELPLASDGWQMFQPPLFHLLAAPLFLLASSLASGEAAQQAVRVLPMLCGMAQVELAYRASRCVFPQRSGLQVVGTVVGGLLPMNIYTSQAAGNEPLAAVLSAALVVYAFSLLGERARGRLGLHALGVGALLGLGLLAKLSILPMLPLLLVVLVAVARARGLPPVAAVRAAGTCLAVVVLVAGWYFLRNQVELGRPVVLTGGWKPDGGLVWWQAPGYRVPADFFHFGTALVQPVYSAVFGLWDGMYSSLWLDGMLSGVTTPVGAPPWNYTPMLAMAWLSLPMTLALLAGLVRSFRWPDTGEARARLFAGSALVVYVAAFVALYAMLPIYSTTKSTYSLGLLPCYAVLTASGLEPFLRGPLTRAVAAGYLSSWAACSYLAFFVVGGPVLRP